MTPEPDCLGHEMPVLSASLLPNVCRLDMDGQLTKEVRLGIKHAPLMYT